jgi:lipoate synthase
LYQFPVFAQFILVLHCPFCHKSKNTGRQVSIQNGNGFNSDLCFVVSVTDMKVRWLMVTVVHRDDDTEEAGNLWQEYLPF